LIPHSIIINGYDIPIRLVKHLYRDHNVYDYYSSADMTIDLDVLMSQQKSELSLCHAIITAIEDIYLLDLEDCEIRDISVVLYDIIKNNRVDLDNDIPDHVIICSCKLDVKSVKNLIEDYTRYGSYSSMDMDIEYDASMKLQRQWVIVFHEIIECIKDVYALELEENEIQVLALVIYDIIKNKRVDFDS
jgi:hypothetical protein